jgi:hypothetical protein
MAPAHAPGPADPGPTPGFAHEKYDYRPSGPEESIVGLVDPILPILGVVDTIAGEWRNGIQRVQLAQGLSMRPADPLPCTYAPGHDHSELKKMIDASEPSQAHELGQLWNDLGNEIMDFGASLQHTATSSEAIWVGQAGNTARAALSALATWSQHTGQGVQFMGTTVRTQAEAAHTAKAAMPEPVLYDPATYQAQLNSTTNPADWARIMGDAREQADRKDAVHAEAVRVIETYSASLRGTNTAMPAFTPPPRFGTGDTGHTPTGPAPGGGVVPPAGGGVTGGAPDRGDGPLRADVGEPAHSGAPPSPTPGQSASYPPPGGLPAGESGGEPGEPSFLPAAAAGTGAAGPGEGGTSTSGRRAGGGFGPRGSGALGASTLAAKLTPSRLATNFATNPLAANSLAANPLGLGDGGATGTGRGTAGLPGSGSGFAPVSGTGRGRGEGDTEHRRPSYLIETEDIWGDGRRVPPPVIGADPPERHR